MEQKTKIMLLCMLGVLLLPSLGFSAGLTFVKSDVGLTSACSYYTLNYLSTGKTQLINNLSTFNVGSIKEVSGDITKLTMEIQAYNSSIGYYWVPMSSYEFGTSKGSYITPTKTNIDAKLSSNYDAIYSKVQADSIINIRICGQYTPQVNGNITTIAIDHIPVVLGVTYDKYAWWNATWVKRKYININTSTSMDNYQVSYMNITFETGMKADFSDLRFTAKDISVEVPYYLSRYAASSWAEVSIKVNISTTNGTQATMYFNNSAASSNSSFDNTFTKAMNYTSSLNVQYHLDDNALAVCTDTSGNGNTGTANGYGWIAADGGYWGNFSSVKFGTGYYFYSTNGYILPASVWHNHPNDNWTLEMWIATNETGSDNATAKIKVPLIGWSDPNVYAAWGIDSSHLCYKHYSGGWIMTCGAVNVSNGTWHHVVYVNYANTSGSLFVDGQLDGGNFDSSVDALHQFEFREIGRGYPAASPVYFNGNFDEIRAYNRSLSLAEIRTNRERRLYIPTALQVGFTSTENYTYEEPQAELVIPTNGSSNVNLTPFLGVHVYSNNSATMNVTFYNATSNAVICANTSVANNSIVYCNWSTATKSLANSSWYVNLSDGYAKNQSYTWWFVTLDTHPPTISVNSPADNYTNITMSIPLLNVTINDTEMGWLNLTFYNATNNAVICTNASVSANNTYSCNWSTLTLTTPGYQTFVWYANVTDGTYNVTTGNYTFNLSMPGVSVNTYVTAVGNYTIASNTTIRIYNATYQINYTGNNVTYNCTALPGGNLTIQALYGSQTKSNVFTNNCSGYENISLIFTANNTAYIFYIYDIYNVPITDARMDFYELTGGSYALTGTSYSQVDGYVYEVYLGAGLPVQVITSKSGYVTRNDTIMPYASTILPIRIRLDEAVVNGSGEYDPLVNLSFTCIPNYFIQNNATIINCQVIETAAQLTNVRLKVYLINYSGSYLSYTSAACVNPLTCSFAFTLNKTASHFFFNFTTNTSYGNYSYIRDYYTNGTADINLPTETDLGRGVWKFIFYVIILILLAITWSYLGAAAILIIPVMVGIGLLYHVFSLGEFILLLLLVFIIFLKMV